jgi:hypothetical protein
VTDREHAEEVRQLVNKLNAAILAAYDEGLLSMVEKIDENQIDGHRLELVQVSLVRPL